jgi:hypothetical protein
MSHAGVKEHGIFSIARSPLQPFPPKYGECLFTLEGHGGKRTPSIELRRYQKDINADFDKSVLSNSARAIPEDVLQRIQGRPHTATPATPAVPLIDNDMTATDAGGVEFFVARVMGNTWSPGLSWRADEKSPVSNFTARLPMVAKLVAERWRASGNDLKSLEEHIMTKVKILDEACGVIYHKEKTSNPELTSEDEFYIVYRVNRDNFLDAFNRVIHPVPNQGEGLDPDTNRPLREVQYGPVPFKYYGLFVVAVSGGGLPETCTLSNQHTSLLHGGYPLDRETYPLYRDTEDLQRYNLIAWENREDVEMRIGVCNGFLNANGGTMPGMEDAWNAFKHDVNGPIQILRRAIFVEEITHIESVILLRSLGYIKQGAIDSACNCSEDLPPEPTVEDSAEDSFARPMSHKEILALNETEFEFFSELYKKRQDMRRIARKAKKAAAAAEAANQAAEQAAAAAAAAVLNVEEVQRFMDIAREGKETVTRIVKEATDAKIEADDVIANLEPRFAGDPSIIKSYNKASEFTVQASNSATMANASYDGLHIRLESLTEEAAGHAGLNTQRQAMPERHFTDTGNEPGVPFQVFGARGGFVHPPSSDALGLQGSSTTNAFSEYHHDVRRTTSAGPASAEGNMPLATPNVDLSPVVRTVSANSYFTGQQRAKRGAETVEGAAHSQSNRTKRGGSRKLRKRTTIRRKKIMRKTKKRTYRKKSQKRNNRK